MTKLINDPTAHVLLRSAFNLLGDGAGAEWGDNPEYTRAITELVYDTIGHKLIEAGLLPVDFDAQTETSQDEILTIIRQLGA